MRKLNKRIQFLEAMYERKGDSGAFLISTMVERYSDIFNSLDPAPPKTRDLDQNLLNFIDECSLDIPMKYPIVLQIQVPAEIRDPALEERIRKGISTYFAHWLFGQEHNISKSYWRTLVYFLTGMLFLLVLNLTGISSSANFGLKLATQGLYVGGWVFLWEAVAELAFKSRELHLSRRRIKRSAEAPVEFISR